MSHDLTKSPSAKQQNHHMINSEAGAVLRLTNSISADDVAESEEQPLHGLPQATTKGLDCHGRIPGIQLSSASLQSFPCSICLDD
jgi:hypothetical protein